MIVIVSSIYSVVNDHQSFRVFLISESKIGVETFATRSSEWFLNARSQLDSQPRRTLSFTSSAFKNRQLDPGTQTWSYPRIEVWVKEKVRRGWESSRVSTPILDSLIKNTLGMTSMDAECDSSTAQQKLFLQLVLCKKSFWCMSGKFVYSLTVW